MIIRDFNYLSILYKFFDRISVVEKEVMNIIKNFNVNC